MQSQKNRINLFISDKANISYHCHANIELLFVVTGTCTVFCNGENFEGTAGDIFLFPSNQIHAYRSEVECIHIACQIDAAELLDIKESPSFYVNSAADPDTDKYAMLRSHLANLVLSQEIEDSNMRAMSYIYLILSELLLNFSDAKKTGISRTQQNAAVRETPASILNYISMHYAESLTLNGLADQFHFSVPYLSSLFKKTLHMTFTDYYNSVRINHAMEDLLSNNEPVESIAHNNGFTDVRTFVRIFKEKYGISPAAYRKGIRNNSLFAEPDQGTDSFFHPSLGRSKYQKLLENYCISNTEDFKNTADSSDAETTSIYKDCGTLSFCSDVTETAFPFEKICYVNHFHQLLEEDSWQMLRRLQSECRFDYVAFDLVAFLDSLNDSMPSSERKYYRFDKIAARLLSLQLKPMFSMIFNSTFFPVIYEGEEDVRISAKQTYLQRLYARLAEFSSYIIDRYGILEVQTWIFRTWYDPVKASLSTESSQFSEFYNGIYQTLKSVNTNLVVGIHLFLSDHIFRDTPVNDFFDYCYNQKCTPDYIVFEYNDSTIQKIYGNNQTEYFEQFTRSLRQFVQDFHLQSQTISLMDSNLSANRSNPVNDSCFKSCYIMRNMLHGLRYHKSVGSWPLLDSSADASALFHGGRGIYTYNAIPKPFFHAFRYLEKLEKTILANEDGWVVTRSERRIVILFLDYAFFDQLSRNSFGSTRRTSPFQNMEKMYYSLKLEKIPFEHYIMRQSSLSQSHGSAFDAWNEIGSSLDELPNRSDYMKYLMDITTDLPLSSGKIYNGILNIEALLEPLEIRLIEIDLL